MAAILLHAARYGKAEALASTADKLQGETALHRAALLGNAASLQLLLNAGAPVDHRVRLQGDLL